MTPKELIEGLKNLAAVTPATQATIHVPTSPSVVGSTLSNETTDYNTQRVFSTDLLALSEFVDRLEQENELLVGRIHDLESKLAFYEP